MSLLELDEIQKLSINDIILLENEEYPTFRIPLHSMIDDKRVIVKFDMNFLEEKDLIFKAPKYYENGKKYRQIVFLHHFGKCTVLNGLRDKNKEFHIICFHEYDRIHGFINREIHWFYLSNEEYADILIKQKLNKNSKKFYKSELEIGGVYKTLSVYSITMFQELKNKVYVTTSNFPYKTNELSNQTNIPLKQNDEFLILKKIKSFKKIEELEQKDDLLEFKKIILSDNAYQILIAGKELMGWIDEKVLDLQNLLKIL